MSKVCIIGLDGGTFRVIDYLVGEKRLPNFARLLNGGSRATLMSSRPPLTPAAWASFYTGMNPGKTGAIDFFRRLPGTYKLSPVHGSSISGTPIWSLASSQGRRVCVYNVPVTYPASSVNGIMISGMDAPSRLDDRAVYPHEFKETFLAAFPDFEIEPTVDGKYIVSHFEDPTGEHISRLRAYLKLQIDVITFLLEMEQWDLFTAVIRSTDSYQHAFWGDVEKVIEGDNVTTEELRRAEAVFSCYEVIDREIENSWAKHFADKNLVIMSDHGFGRLEREVCLNRILSEAGLLKFRSKSVGRRIREHIISGILSRLSGRLSANMRRNLMQFLNNDRLASLMFVDALIADIDWTKTRLYSIGQFGCLFVNQIGREPMGIVADGNEREAVLAEAKAALAEITDPEDGLPIMTEFYFKDDLYHGPLADAMPDMVVVMRDHAYRGVYSTFAEQREESIIRRPYREWKELAPTGCHRRQGMLMMHGPDIGTIELGPANIVDVAPTVLHLLGLPVPDDCDGKILEQAISGRGSRPIPAVGISQEPDIAKQPAASVYSEEDEEEVRKRLRDLGYL